MEFITLDEAKEYLRIDSSDEDATVTALLTAAETLCREISRLTDDEWASVCQEKEDAENGVEPSETLKRNRALLRAAILYATAYLFEHREEADHHDLVMTLRYILFSIREGVNE